MMTHSNGDSIKVITHLDLIIGNDRKSHFKFWASSSLAGRCSWVRWGESVRSHWTDEKIVGRGVGNLYQGALYKSHHHHPHPPRLTSSLKISSTFGTETQLSQAACALECMNCARAQD